jgi:hypothetical protein
VSDNKCDYLLSDYRNDKCWTFFIWISFYIKYFEDIFEDVCFKAMFENIWKNEMKLHEIDWRIASFDPILNIKKLKLKLSINIYKEQRPQNWN